MRKFKKVIIICLVFFMAVYIPAMSMASSSDEEVKYELQNCEETIMLPEMKGRAALKPYSWYFKRRQIIKIHRTTVNTPLILTVNIGPTSPLDVSIWDEDCNDIVGMTQRLPQNTTNTLIWNDLGNRETVCMFMTTYQDVNVSLSGSISY